GLTRQPVRGVEECRALTICVEGTHHPDIISGVHIRRELIGGRLIHRERLFQLLVRGLETCWSGRAREVLSELPDHLAELLPALHAGRVERALTGRIHRHRGAERLAVLVYDGVVAIDLALPTDATG